MSYITVTEYLSDGTPAGTSATNATNLSSTATWTLETFGSGTNQKFTFTPDKNTVAPTFLTFQPGNQQVSAFYTSIYADFSDNTVGVTLKGGAKADYLRGGSGNDTLNGGAGDKIEGGAGADTLSGGSTTIATYEHSAQGLTIAIDYAFWDQATGDAVGDIINAGTIFGSNFNDIVYGWVNNETLYGKAGNDRLIGSDGDDVLVGGAGADVLDGGNGNDTASYLESAGVRADLTGGGNGGEATGDTYISIENLTGGAGNDDLTGDGGNNILSGGSGDDVLEGGGGADTFKGGDGIDTVTYRLAGAGVFADMTTPGNNTGDATGDNYSAPGYYLQIENMNGSSYADHLVGNELDNVIDGGPGADIIDGAGGSDTASYASASGSGITVDLGTPSNNTGAATGDTYISIENLLGSVGDDRLVGNAGANVLTGASGNDTLIGGAGGDALIGGNGVDIASYESATIGVYASLIQPGANTGDAAGDSYSSIEKLVGSALGDTLAGDANNNTLTGGNGDDILIGGAGLDVLDGGSGSDTASYENATVRVTASLGQPGANSGDAIGDTYTSIENLTGSAFNDTLTGDAGANRLDGGGGDDLLAGGGGADFLIGNQGNDTATYAASSAAVTVSLAANTGSGGDAAGDTFSGIENLIGSTGNDRLAGDDGANSLAGGNGDDTLIGGAGGDYIDGGSGFDVASYETAAIGVYASLIQPGANTGDAAGDSYSSIEKLVGSAQGDTLVGDASANTLAGGDGNDVLVGGAGGDVLDGGNGSDTASYESAATGVRVALDRSATFTGDAIGDTFTSIENVTGSGFNDILIGDSNANILSGGGGSDAIYAGAGDTVYGGADADQITAALSAAAPITIDGGGDGSQDSVFLSQVPGATFTLAGAAGGGTTVTAGGTTLASITNVSYYSIQMVGTQQVVVGDVAGQVVITGDTNADVVDASGTIATTYTVFEGKEGADTYTGGAGYDYISFDYATGSVVVNLSDSSKTVNGAVYASGDALDGYGAGSIDHYYGSIERIFSYNADSVIYTGNNATQVYTGGGADLLVGGSANDRLYAGGGDDLLFGGAGGDLLFGDSGTDTASYAMATTAVTANLSDNRFNIGDAAGDSYVSIENLTGSAGDDTLIGDVGVNILRGGDGNDLLVGGAGGDALIGGDGIDLAGYTTALSGVQAYLDGASGNTGDAQGDTYFGIEGLVGSRFGDVLVGDSGDNIIVGGAGADAIDGGSGGNDTVSFEGATIGVVANLATGTGTAGDAAGDTYVGIENLGGGIANDTLVGDAGVNILAGRDGNDILFGGAGADTLDGGAGTDSASYAGSTTAIYATLVTPANNTGDAAGDTYISIEGLIGGDAADILVGDAGNNRLNGGDGDDSLTGGDGADALIGGDGLDTANYGGALIGVTANLADSSKNSGEAAGDTYFSIERIGGSNYADILIGDAGDNTLRGKLGADTLSGGDGNDTLIMEGAGGMLDGGAGDDTIFLYATPGSIDGGDGTGDILTVQAGLQLDFEAIAIAGIERINVQDGASIDLSGAAGRFDVLRSLSHVGAGATIHGTALADTITGGAGNDLLDGGAGNDRITVISDDGIIDGGADTDQLVVRGTGTMTFTDANLSHVERMLITQGQTVDASGVSIGMILQVSAGTSATSVIGTSGSDRIIGSNGADTLMGAGGTDNMTGGGGADIFKFGSLAEMSSNNVVDRIADFSNAQEDKIDLSAIDPDALLDGDQTFRFIGTNAFTGKFGRDYEVRVKEGANGAFLQFDINHDGRVDAQIFVSHDAPFTASDFIL